MTCEKPIKIINKNTKEEIEVPCRKCILCRQKRSRDWALKLIKEGLYHKDVCMVTLTFSPKFLLRPYWQTLYKWKRIKDKNSILGHKTKRIKYKTCISPKYITDVRLTGWLVTRFIKKFRKEIYKKYGKYITFFAAGEHGTNKTHRAHWHIIFYGVGIDMLNCVSTGVSKRNKEIYISPEIAKLWTFKKLSIGSHTVSDVTDRTIKYVANYTLKKMYNNTTEKNEKYKTCFRFSNQGKIGTKWIRRYHTEIRKGYIEDKDKGRYSIPEGWLKELERYQDNLDIDKKNKIIYTRNIQNLDNKSMIESASIYRELIQDKIIKMIKDKNFDIKEEAKKKAERLRIRYSKEDRDFC